MKVFITGGAGFIGAHVSQRLIDEGDEVILYDSFLNYIPPYISHYPTYLEKRLEFLKGKVEVIRGDIRQKSFLLRTLKEHKPDAVIHLAALPISTVSNVHSEDAFEINLKGTVNILETLRSKESVKRFVYASSSMVYGNFKRASADENHPTDPIDVYGATKLSGEILTRAYASQYGIDYTIIRPSSVYGPTDANRRVSQIFVENAIAGKTLCLEGGGASKLDFTYVKDIAQGFVSALKSDKAVNETFNITYGESKSLKEFTQILNEIIPGIKTEEIIANFKRPERGTLDISKAKKMLGYAPEYPLEKGLREYVDFVKTCGVIES